MRFRITSDTGEVIEVDDVAMAQLEAEGRARQAGVPVMDAPMLATVAMAYASHQILLHGTKRGEWEPWDEWIGTHRVEGVDTDEVGPTDADPLSD